MDTSALCHSTTRRVANRAGQEEHGGVARPGERVRIVAQGIVDAFLKTHESDGSHSRTRRDEKAEMVAQIEWLIERGQG